MVGEDCFNLARFRTKGVRHDERGWRDCVSQMRGCTVHEVGTAAMWLCACFEQGVRKACKHASVDSSLCGNFIAECAAPLLSGCQSTPRSWNAICVKSSNTCYRLPTVHRSKRPRRLARRQASGSLSPMYPVWEQTLRRRRAFGPNGTGIQGYPSTSAAGSPPHQC